jgi:hypothetical protein
MVNETWTVRGSCPSDSFTFSARADRLLPHPFSYPAALCSAISLSLYHRNMHKKYREDINKLIHISTQVTNHQFKQRAHAWRQNIGKNWFEIYCVSLPKPPLHLSSTLLSFTQTRRRDWDLLLEELLYSERLSLWIKQNLQAISFRPAIQKMCVTQVRVFVQKVAMPDN